MGPQTSAAGAAYTTNIFEESRNQFNSCEVGSVVLQGPLLKRSDTARQWEWRWFILHVLTGKLEYWSHGREAPSSRVLKFDIYSTVAISPVNMMKEAQYDACCFYITTSQKREHFFCAQTPEAAEAWVATLRAAVSVRQAHNDASNLLSNNSQSELGNVAVVVAAAKIISQDAAHVLQTSTTVTTTSPSASIVKLNPAAASTPSACSKERIITSDMDGSYLMREELKVKDKEIRQLARDLKSRNNTIKELGDRLVETAEAAESAASSVHLVHKRYKESLSEVDRLRKQLSQAAKQIRDAEARRAAASKVEEAAVREAHRCRLELAKLQERGTILQATMVHIDDNIRQLHDVRKTELIQRLEVPKSRIDRVPQIKIPVMGAISRDNYVSEAGYIDSNSGELHSETCGDDETLLYTSPASVLDLRVDESEAETLPKYLKSRGTSKFTDVDSENDESISEASDVQTKFPDTAQVSELELTGTCEALVSRALMISTPKLVSCAPPTEDGDSPSVIETDHHELEVDVCSTLFRPPEASPSNDWKGVPSPPSFPASPLLDMVLAGCCEVLASDSASRQTVPSCQLPVDLRADEVAGFTRSATSSQELSSDAVCYADNASPSPSVSNYREIIASLYPTISKTDSTALASQSNSTQDFGGVLTDTACTDSSSEATPCVNGNEDYCNTVFENEVVETKASDEVQHITGKDIEVVPSREATADKTVANSHQIQGYFYFNITDLLQRLRVNCRLCI